MFSSRCCTYSTNQLTHNHTAHRCTHSENDWETLLFFCLARGVFWDRACTGKGLWSFARMCIVFKRPPLARNQFAESGAILFLKHIYQEVLIFSQRTCRFDRSKRFVSLKSLILLGQSGSPIVRCPRPAPDLDGANGAPCLGEDHITSATDPW